MRLLSIYIGLIVAWALFFSGLEAPHRAPGTAHHFAFAVNPSANNQLITYGIVTTNIEGTVVKTRVITKENFILQVYGQQYSDANPDGEDLWSKNEIGKCYYWLNSLIDKYEPVECEAGLTIEDLWRLRYKRNPQYRQDKVTSDDKILGGWAANTFRPNWPQLQILQQYGVTYPSDYFFGDNMFKLMKDVQDETWIEGYMSAE